MGLNIAVGYLADLVEQDEEGAEWLRAALDDLNAVLADAGEAPHHEPETIVGGPRSWQSYGYSGLHHLRRLAAWVALRQQLPEPCRHDDPVQDPVTAAWYEQHRAFAEQPTKKEWRTILPTSASRTPTMPGFAHLMLHSDAEGFYLPRPMDVVFDQGDPQRSGAAGMVGSAHRLLAECLELAAILELPADIDPEADDIYENIDLPLNNGAPWQRHAIETFVLTRLIAACEASLATGAAVVFC